MHIKNKLAYRLAIIATILALFVIMLGAYTRLKDAGLGCPDWPGCYGQISVPDTPHRLLLAVEEFPGQTVQASKAWPEMIHRYVAGTLGLLIAISALLVIARYKLARQPIGIALTLLAVLVFQILLGKWTVTMEVLPVVVMSHLLGGMALFSLLALLVMRLGNFFTQAGKSTEIKKFRCWALLGLMIVIGQIFLGGWTSTNYAALICPDFPFCQGQLMPSLDFSKAFHFWMPLGVDYQGGVLDNAARVTIQEMHRLGALVTAVYLFSLAVWILIASKAAQLKKIAGAILFILVLQISLGILNVLWLLPLPIAVAHNGMAAILLLTMVILNYALYSVDK